MSLENMVSQFEKKASSASPIGGSIKFEVDGQGILIDGSGDSNTVKASDEEADCTISVDKDDFIALASGSLDPMMAFMSGKLKVAGDMSVAMGLQSLFSNM